MGQGFEFCIWICGAIAALAVFTKLYWDSLSQSWCNLYHALHSLSGYGEYLLLEEMEIIGAVTGCIILTTLIAS